MKKIYILVEGNEIHNQQLDVFGTREEAETAMRERFFALLSPDAREKDRGEFYKIHSDWAWINWELSKDELETDWQIWEKEVQL